MTATKAAPKKAAPKATRAIQVVLKGGRRKIVSNIPAGAKITYGPVSPGASHHGQENALRIYTSQQNQLAVFVGVQEFRDLSLTVAEEHTKRKASSESSSNGDRKANEEVETEWVVEEVERF